MQLVARCERDGSLFSSPNGITIPLIARKASAVRRIPVSALSCWNRTLRLVPVDVSISNPRGIGSKFGPQGYLIEAKLLREGVLQANTVVGSDQCKAVLPVINLQFIIDCVLVRFLTMQNQWI